MITITSAEENNFLKKYSFCKVTIKHTGSVHTRLEMKTGKNPTSNWHWVTGEEWDYTDWYSAEPNNSQIDEFHLSADQRFNYQWNDEGSAIPSMINGYVMEKPSAPTPIPGAIWLLGASLIGLFGIKKKFAK